MGLDRKLIPELVSLAKYLKDNGTDLGDWRAYMSGCGCVGAQKGEYLCPCAQQLALEQNMVTVVAEFDEEQARQIMLRRIVGSLPG